MKTRAVAILMLFLILLYSGVRTYTTLKAHRWKAVSWVQKVELNPQSALQNLEEFFVRLTDDVYAYDDARNPLVRIKKDVEARRQPKRETSVVPRPVKVQPRAQLTALVLDRDPVATIKIGNEEFKLRRGDFFQGGQVIEIDEQGVHLLADGAIKTIGR